MNRLARLLLIAICGLVLGQSVSLLSREYSVVFLLRGTMNDQIDTLLQPTSPPRPASARTTRELLTACGRILTTAPRIRAEPDTAAGIRAACGRISATLLRDAPMNARARAVALISTAPEFSAEELAVAQMAAPHEPWPLLMRVEAVALRAESGPAPGADLLLAAEADFGRALLTRWGRERIAALYVDRPDLRPTIRNVAATIPAGDQRAFLTTVRSATQGAR